VPRGSPQDLTVTKFAPDATVMRFDDDASAQQALMTGQADLLGTAEQCVGEAAKCGDALRDRKQRPTPAVECDASDDVRIPGAEEPRRFGGERELRGTDLPPPAPAQPQRADARHVFDHAGHDSRSERDVAAESLDHGDSRSRGDSISSRAA